MSNNENTRRILGPFNRVEGDLEVKVDISAGQVTEAWVNAPLYRGFETILAGKDPRDALVYTPRICGICSVSQSVASSRAIAAAQGLAATANGRLATNIILACENLADHLSHFYLFFMPDFAREVYNDQPWYNDIRQRFQAQQGAASLDVLPQRAEFMKLTGILAGKWPHSLALQPGGTTRAIDSREKLRLQGLIMGFRRFLETTVFGDKLENIQNLTSIDALLAWRDNHQHSDFGRFLMLADSLQLDQLGRAGDNFMSYGAYHLDEQISDDINQDTHAFKPGLWCNDQLETLDPSLITEDISHAWMRAQREPKHPSQGTTMPDENASGAYSWCKAPRYNKRVVEVGALARQVIDGHPLIRALVAESGGNVQNRVIARLLELARVLPLMEIWNKEIKLGESFCESAHIPRETQGMGLVEAARGSLGHWLDVRNGLILNYQIIAPTTWNFSPRDENNIPGALERALVGTPVDRNGQESVAIQHIVRSFDPCMVCTVH